MNTEKIRPGKPNGIKKIQIGCGPKYILDDWWNVDLRIFKGIDEAFDATKVWPFLKCAEYIYAEHFLEHLSFKGAVDFLDNSRSALVDGGRIRLSTPSLEWVLKTHFTFQSATAVDQTWAINRAFRGWGHQFLYSKETLIELLSSRGFSSIEFFDYGKSNDLSLIGLERHGGYRIVDGFPSVWIVEAIATNSVIDDSFFNEGQNKFYQYVESGH